ncbi:hypothetical protein HPB48_001564 [Haemaphysalis longicornis]|uniref:Uncharacterized protein n=1 Tax=Haemaphysalis longicornis TaxID=44386 RepID=A0A9J6F758_HAELO|nr:hypothetical protein HPB48_001564 [Haemaphysalis longicornis]
MQTSVLQLSYLIWSIENQRGELKDQDTTQIVQAMVINRITYCIPYILLAPSEKAKLNVIIRKAYKTALDVSIYAYTEILFELDLFNTLEELIEGQQVSQRERLLLTATERLLLGRLGYSFLLVIRHQAA